MLWKCTCLLFLHPLAFVPSSHFHASFPPYFPSIFISLEWGIVAHSFETWSLAPHFPIPYPLVLHIIPPFRYTQPSHPFSIPWFSRVIGLHLLYHVSFHIKFNPILPPLQSIHLSSNSNHSNHFTLIKFLVFHSTHFPLSNIYHLALLHSPSIPIQFIHYLIMSYPNSSIYLMTLSFNPSNWAYQIVIANKLTQTHNETKWFQNLVHFTPLPTNHHNFSIQFNQTINFFLTGWILPTQA